MKFDGINNVDLDLPRQVEFNRRKNVTQDAQISNLTSQVNSLLEQAPAGFLPRAYYGLVVGTDTYRFDLNATILYSVEDTEGTAYQLYAPDEPDNGYIPAVAVKMSDYTLKIIVRGDYRAAHTVFNIVNMQTGDTAELELTPTRLSLSTASSLLDYPAATNREKQITIINCLETNSKNVIFASLDYNNDGVYNWVEIGNFVDGIDGKSIYGVTAATLSSVLIYARIGDLLLAGEDFISGANEFGIGDLFEIEHLTPSLELIAKGNIRGAQGEQGETGAPGQDGENGKTPYIQSNYWYIDGVSTGVKAIGTDGSDGEDGQSFQIQSGLYSTPDNWGESDNEDPEGNALLELPTLPTTGITGKGYIVYDPLTTPLSPYYDLYFANDNDVSWTIIHPFNGVNGRDGTNGKTPYIQDNYWYIDGVNTGVKAIGTDGSDGARGSIIYYYSSTIAGNAVLLSSLTPLTPQPKTNDWVLDAGGNIIRISSTSSTYATLDTSSKKNLVGATGATPSISATANITSDGGSPAVSVTKTGTDLAPVLNFTFSNLASSNQNTPTPVLFTITAAEITSGTLSNANTTIFQNELINTLGNIAPYILLNFGTMTTPLPTPFDSMSDLPYVVANQLGVGATNPSDITTMYASVKGMINYYNTNTGDDMMAVVELRYFPYSQVGTISIQTHTL